MEALQYIYTSWKNGDSTEKGYMIYSRSEGVTESECSAIKTAMQYLAPKNLTMAPTPEEIADVFPYAFSYFILPTGRGCVAQSTYLGKDYSGRYGNYIIYALIFDVDDLPCRPAELFAEPYIKTAMTQEELDAPSPVPPLPPLQITDYASVINDDQLNEFLFDREDEFAQLLSMVLAAQDAGIPFYLNDSRENLVLWSAAVQRVLPPKLAKKFFFNTYIGDHESMRSQKARDEGLHFHLIGVRPDANHFNYATESRSNRQIVMDFLDGHMTEGVMPNRYAQAMAASMAFDGEEVDSFGEFLDSTAFGEINGRLEDAYLYYHLLRNDEFTFSESDLKAVLSFGAAYCSDADNSEVGSKLLMKSREGGWGLEPETLALFWKFICRYSGFMIFTLYELFTEAVFQCAGDASAPCTALETLMQTVKDETPQHYREYLGYLDVGGGADQLLLYLSGHENPFTNTFYINWLQQNFVFSDGLSDGQPISRLLRVLLENITHISGCEAQMIELLLAAADNPVFFAHILDVFMTGLREPAQLEHLCVKYVEIAASLRDREINRFERLLLETPGGAPLATRLCARKIASAKNPEEEFWRFYDNQRARIAANPGFTLDPMILACVNHVDARKREDAAIDILRKIDASLIGEDDTVRMLTDAVNGCSIKTLAKMDGAFLQEVCRLRSKIDAAGLEKIRAVSVGGRLARNNAQRNRPVRLSEELFQAGITLQSTDKSDYETYLKQYFDEYFVLVQASEDVSALMGAFYHSQFFSSFVDDYLSALKKMEKKETERWKCVLGWTCVYTVMAERSDRAAEELYKPLVRYLRSLDEDQLLSVRQAVIQEIPSTRCDYLFNEARRKEGFSEKLGNLFHKK